GVYFEFLTPPRNPEADDNEQSCVLRVLANGQAVLAGGDLGIAGERWLVGTYGDSLHSQLLVLGHHGSRSSSDSAYLNAVAPEAAVAANGFANPYGHPAAIVRHRLSAHRIRLYTTARSGQLDFVLGQSGAMQPQCLGRRFWQRKPFEE
ncbi:DNA internalization-related competence protein ComEC/Rec2, partial [Eikenella corrodens]|nr:DNA internalization-related competence protein ComEC/Rec2 [Eikenella corrodens]